MQEAIPMLLDSSMAQQLNGSVVQAIKIGVMGQIRAMAT
jgi:hypothetical protein